MKRGVIKPYHTSEHLWNQPRQSEAGTWAQGSWHSNISFTPGGALQAPFGGQQGTQVSVLCLSAQCLLVISCASTWQYKETQSDGSCN